MAPVKKVRTGDPNNMKHSSTRRGALTALIAIGSIAIALFGCGGGGDGGTGTSATATSTTSTSTTSTSTTSTSTTSTSTTSTSTTSTSTTSTSTTSTSTTSTSTTSTATTSGSWPANVIFYTQIDPAADSFEVRHINPDGSGDVSFASLANTFVGVTVNPAVANQVVFAFQADSGSAIGIYKNSTPSMTGATQLVSPAYGDVNSLQVSSDGKFVYFVANAKTGTGTLFKVSINGGTPTPLDQAESAHVNLAGDQVVYAKAASNNNRVLFVRGTGVTDAPVQITNDGNDATMPQFSKGGTTIVFSRTSGSTYDLFTIPVAGGTATRITNTPTTDEWGASFNDNGSQVSFVASAFDTAQSGIWRTATSGVDVNRTQLKAITNSGDSTYWTSMSGRSASGPYGFVLNLLLRRRH